jgi:hypothetical protein
MLYLGTDDIPLGRAKARELLAREPRVVGHRRAWIDDHELCLEVECRLRGGDTVVVRMEYCWATAEFFRRNYFMDITEFALNGDWPGFYGFVQERLDAALGEHANHDFDQDCA